MLKMLSLDIRKIVLFGAGRRCERIIDLLKQNGIHVCAIFDNSVDNTGRTIKGVRVTSLDYLEEYRGHAWCITIKNNNDVSVVKKQMHDAGYIDENYVDYDKLYWTLIMQSVRIDTKMKSFHSSRCQRQVLFCCANGLNLGGIEARTVMLCKALNENKRESYILSDMNEPTLDLAKEIRGYIIKTKIASYDCSEKERLESVVDAIVERLPCTIITSQPDLMLFAAYLVRFYCPEKIKIISVVSGLNKAIMDNYFKFGEISDYYIGVSRDIGAELERRGIPRSIIDTMTVPFPCPEILKREWSDQNTVIKIGYAGRLDGFEGSQKRMDLVMELMGKLKEYGVDFHFDIAGDGLARCKMEDFFQSNGMGNRVTFWGTIRKASIQDFWRKQDVAINMADYEGRSISTVEAMGAGAVPVVTDVSGVREDIIDGENGYIVPIGDYISAAKKIQYLNYHRNLLSLMGNKAHDTVWPKSRMEGHLQFWTETFQKIDH